MYGDMMYCKTCGHMFMDVWRHHDTRTEKQLISNCPNCLSMHTMNADAFIEKYESMGTTNQYTASFTVLYNHLKMQHKDFHDNKYNVGYADVYLMDRERINSKRKV